MIATNGATSPFHWRTARPANNATEAFTHTLGLLNNIYSMRAEVLRRHLDPRRDLDEECGYPKPSEMTPRKYKDLYDREPYANRAVRVWPLESWQVQPQVYELERNTVQTPFEKYWDALGRRLRGDSCYYAEEKGSAVYEYLLRADIQCGIGQYAVILLGLDDTDDQGRGIPLHFPVRNIPIMRDCVGVDNPELDQYSMEYMRPKAKELPILDDSEVEAGLNPDLPDPDPNAPTPTPPTEEPTPQEELPIHNLLYMRVYPQTQVQVTQYETNQWNPRFGQPVMYSIQAQDPNAMIDGQMMSVPTIRVHWTRILHVVDNIESNEVHCKPRLEPILNPICDIQKVRGSSAEMYYKGAFPGISIESLPQFGAEVQVNEEQLKDMMELYQNSLQRFITLFGMTAKQLAPQVTDPTPQILAQIQAICVQLGIPMRVFMGSERGELASTQDDQAWNDRLRERQNRHITPRIICLFVDRLVMLRVLPVPKRGYKVFWPDLTSQTAQEKAAYATSVVSMLAAYVGGGVDQVMTLVDVFTKLLGWSEEEAVTALNAAMKEAEAAAAQEEGAPQDPGDDTATEEEAPLPATEAPNNIPQPSMNRQYKQTVRLVRQMETLATNITAGLERIFGAVKETNEKQAQMIANAIRDQTVVHNHNITTPKQDAPVVNNNITVPPQETPLINIEVPQQAPPTVNLQAGDIFIPPQERPVVNVEVVTPELLNVKIIDPVEIEKEETKRKVRIEGPNGTYEGTLED